MRIALLLGLCTSLFLFGCADASSREPGPVTTETEAVAAAQQALGSGDMTIMGPASRYIPESGRVVEEQPGAWLVAFDLEPQEGIPADTRISVQVDKETGDVTIPGMPGITL